MIGIRKSSEEDKKKAWEQVSREFPDDPMLRDIHYVREIHRMETSGIPFEKIIQYYHKKSNQARKRISGATE